MSSEYELQIAGAPFVVASVRGREAVGEPFSFDVVARPEEPGPIEIGAEATLSWPLEDGSTRTVNAIVDAVEEHAGGDTGKLATRGATVLRLVPRLASLADGVDHEVFLDQDALQIAEAVLSANGVTLEKRVNRTPSKRAMCVQAFESDLAFVTRILAEEGILWFPHPDEADVIVAADNPSGFAPAPGDPIVVRAAEGMIAGRSAWGVGLATRAVTDKVTLRDFDFEAPSVDLTVAATEGQGTSERYEYRVGYTDPSVGKKLAKLRLEEHRRHRLRADRHDQRAGPRPRRDDRARGGAESARSTAPGSSPASSTPPTRGTRGPRTTSIRPASTRSRKTPDTGRIAPRRSRSAPASAACRPWM